MTPAVLSVAAVLLFGLISWLVASRSAARKFPWGEKGCAQVRRFEVDSSLEAAMAACRGALLTLRFGARIAREDPDAAVLEAVTSRRLTSWGEEIRFRLVPLGPHRTQIVLHCSQTPTGTALDGKKRAAHNVVLATLDALHAKLAPGSLPAPTTSATVSRKAGGLDTCPFCKDAVDPAAAVACTACLARHHGECWDEHTQCAACGSNERFAGTERTEGRAPRPPEQEKA